MNADDAAFLLFDSLDNLPSEVSSFMNELKAADTRTADISRKIKTRDTTLQKHIRQSERGSLDVSPKEQEYYPKIRSDFQKILDKSYDKERMAEKVLELLDRTLRKIDDESRKISILEGSSGGASGLLSGLGTPVSEKSQAAAFASALSGANGGGYGAGGSASGTTTPSGTPRPLHKRARSSLAPGAGAGSPSGGRGGGAGAAADGSKPAVSSALAVNPPLLPNGYPAPPANLSAEDNDDTETYCFCEQVSYGEMVACDNDHCHREWFHYGCVGLKEPPIGKWYCSDCAKVRVK